MVRTVISLDPELKAWLDAKARASGQSMTATVREALAAYRAEEAKREQPTRAELLERTRGIWRQGDGLAWQQSLRDEWQAR